MIELLVFTPDVSCPQEDMPERHRTERTYTEVHVSCSSTAAGKGPPTPPPRKHAGERREEERSAFFWQRVHDCSPQTTDILSDQMKSLN